MNAALMIFVQTGTRQALHHALSVALTALSAGDSVTIALFYDGLGAWIQSLRSPELSLPLGDFPWSESLEMGFERLNAPSVERMVGTCREIGDGRFRVYACGASVEFLGHDVSALVDAGVLDDVLGLPGLWRRAEGSRLLSI